MKHLNVWAVWVAFAAVNVAGVAMAADPKPAPEEMTGVKVGEKAPDFALMGIDGKEYKLSTMIKDAPVAVMFFRSSNW